MTQFDFFLRPSNSKLTFYNDNTATAGDNLNIHFCLSFKIIYENKNKEALITESAADESYHAFYQLRTF